MSDTTAIATIETIALPVKFVTEEVTDAIENIRRAAMAEADGLDISRPGDRDKIKSVAHRVSKSKAAMERLGKSLSDRRKAEIADEVNAIMVERKRIESELDALRDQIRAPVTEWERKEEQRIAGHEAAISAIDEMKYFSQDDIPSGYIQDRLDAFNALPSRKWEEFEGRAEQSMSITREDLTHKLGLAIKREHEAAELARLRAEDVERQRKAHESQIAAVAAENAKREAEEKARAEAVAEAARVEAERLADEAAARDERLAAAAREAEIQAAANREKQARIDAENAAKRAEEQRAADAKAAEQRRADDARIAAAREEAARVAAGIEQAAAIERERQRVAKIKADEVAAQQKREADTKHRAKINAAARDALSKIITKQVSIGAENDAALATEIVKAIAKGEIPHVRLEY